MTQIYIHNIQVFFLLWVVPVIIGLYVYARFKRRKALNRFASQKMLEKLVYPDTRPGRFLKAVLVSLAFALIVLALSRPAWNPTQKKIPRQGRDIVFVLDVSRSMLAQDLKPSRLERAKMAILDCLEFLRGDRIGLMIFAGSSYIKCPLTLDYTFFRLTLENVSPDIPELGGTRISEAIYKTVNDMFSHEKTGYQDIILISDGEDHGKSIEPAVRELANKGIRLIAIGLGDEHTGARIPVTYGTNNRDRDREAFLKYNGQEVWTRLQPATLRRIARATPGGAYFNVATGSINLGEVYTRLIMGAEKKKFSSRTILQYEDKSQVFLMIAIILLFISAFTDRKRSGRNIHQNTALLLVLLLTITPGKTFAVSRYKLTSKGNKHISNGNYDKALSLYNKALIKAPDSPVITYNMGVAFFRKDDYKKAKDLFKKAAFQSDSSSLRALCRYNMGNSLFYEAQKQRKVNLKEALLLYQQSEHSYKAALENNFAFKDGCYNLEIVRLTIIEIEKEINRIELKADKFMDELNRIKEKLNKLVEQQGNAFNTGKDILQKKKEKEEADSIIKSVKSLIKKQGVIAGETYIVDNQLKKVKLKISKLSFFKEFILVGLVPAVDKAYKHVQQAEKEQNHAIDNLKANAVQKAVPNQGNALEELKNALKVLSGQLNKRKDKQDSEKKDREGEKKKDSESRDADSSDMAKPDFNEDVPAPDEAPEDIFEEERRIWELRRLRKSSKGSTVEKDW